MQLLAEPTIAYILLSLGSIGLFFELSNPGAILPGVVGGLFLLLALYGLGTLPVNWAGVLLIGFGFLLLAIDLFVPSFGSLTIGGLASFVIGSHMLIGEEAPPGFAISGAVIWTLTALLAGFFILVGAATLRTRLRRPTTGREALIGEIGMVRRALAPDGMVFLHGELWQATAAETAGTASIPAGTPVLVTAVDRLRLVVRAATEREAASAGVAIIDPDRSAPAIAGASPAKTG